MKTEVTENIFEQAWDGFKGTNWRDKASVTRFVQENYKPYDGDESFLAGPTERTLKVKKIIEDTKAHYEEVGFPFDTDRVTSIDKIPAGYIDHLAGNEINVPDEAGHEFIDRRLINLGR